MSDIKPLDEKIIGNGDDIIGRSPYVKVKDIKQSVHGLIEDETKLLDNTYSEKAQELLDESKNESLVIKFAEFIVRIKMDLEKIREKHFGKSFTSPQPSTKGGVSHDSRNSAYPTAPVDTIQDSEVKK